MPQSLFAELKKLFKTGFFHIFGSSVANKIIVFLSSIVLVRILSKTEYGAFTYAWNIYSIIILFNAMGIEYGSLQLSSEHCGDIRYAGNVFNYGTKFGLKFNLLLVLMLIGIGLFAPLKIPAGRNLLCALCLLPVIQFLYDMTGCYLRSQKRNQDYAKLQITNTFFTFVASVGCAFLFREMGMVLGHYVAYSIAWSLGLFAFHVRLINKKSVELGEDKSPLLRISFISMLNNGLSQLMYLLDVFILGIVDPQETILASYKVATIIPASLTFIPLSLVVYIYPYFAEHKDNGKWCLRNYKKVLLGLGSFNLILSTFLFVGAPIIVRILFGENYSDAVPIFRLLALNYFFSGTFRILSGNLLVTQRKLKFNLFVAIIASITNATADYFFIQKWGSMGAAYATVLVVLITSILNTTYLIYTFRQKRYNDEKVEL